MSNLQSDFHEASLGKTTELYQPDSAETYRELASRMVSQASRSLYLLTPDLESAIFDQQPFISAVKQLALRTRVARVRVLVLDNSLVRQQGHRLINLAQRLPSTIEVRKPGREHTQLTESFLLVDKVGYILRNLTERFQITACFNDRLKTSQLHDAFAEIWEHGEPDQELIRLHL